jgi:protein TonB
MPDALEDLKDQQQSIDRRSNPRHKVRSLAYVDLDEGNGGIVLNVSESGLSVQAVTPLMDEFLPQIRLQLSESTTPIMAAGQIVWTTNSRKTAGIRFVDFPPEAAGQIRDWIASEAFPLDSPRDDNFPAEGPRAVPDADTIIIANIADDAAAAVEVLNPEPEAAAEVAEVHDPAPPESVGPVWVREETHASDPAPSRSNQAAIHAGPLRTESGKDTKVKVEAGPEVPPPARRQEEHPNWLLYALIGVLAICSTIAGWSVGRTGLYGALAKLRTMSSDPDATAPTASPSQAIKLPGIEIVDLSNRRWIVPFAGAASEAPVTPHPQPVVTLPPQRQTTKSPNRTFALSSSVRPIAAAKPRGADADAPPAISSQTPVNGGAATPLAAISGVTATPLPVPSDPSLTSSGVVQPALLIHRVEPIYPNNATQFYSTDATIKLHVTIGTDGQVQTVTPVSGPPIFYQAAASAIRQWRYRPALVNGKPSSSDGEISIVFRRP